MYAISAEDKNTKQAQKRANYRVRSRFYPPSRHRLLFAAARRGEARQRSKGKAHQGEAKAGPRQSATEGEVHAAKQKERAKTTRRHQKQKKGAAHARRNNQGTHAEKAKGTTKTHTLTQTARPIPCSLPRPLRLTPLRETAQPPQTHCSVGAGAQNIFSGSNVT